MVHDKRNIDQIKKSIRDFNDHSKKEKDSLTDSIEMFWLNAGIQKKKPDVKFNQGKNEQITRIRHMVFLKLWLVWTLTAEKV